MNKEYKKRINRALAFISKNLDRDITLDEIAEIGYFSKYHFHRIFKAVTGETVSAHIRRLRLEKAANRILSDSGETMTSLALDCGFGSSQNFATAFKKQFGFSPRKFRERYSLEAWAAKADSAEAAGSIHPIGSISPQSLKNDSEIGSLVNLWINLMDMPAYHVAYERTVGPYGFKNFDTVFKNLFKWAYKRCSIDASLALGIVWDNPEVTPPKQCRYDACITIPDNIAPKGDIGVQEIQGGKYVVGHCEVASYMELEQAYENIFLHWFPTSNYTPADSVAYEIYLNNPANHPRESLLIDICIPVDKI